MITPASDVVGQKFVDIFTDYYAAVQVSRALGKMQFDVITAEDLKATSFSLKAATSQEYIHDLTGIGNFTKLVSLKLEFSDLGSIPADIDKLQKLEVLDFSINTRLNDFGKLDQLVNLKDLNLYLTAIGPIPESINNLVNLEKLDLSVRTGTSSITELPSSITKLTKLKSLVC